MQAVRTSIALLVAAFSPLMAQSNERPADVKAFTFDTQVQGSSSTLGNVTRIDLATGYILNRHWSVDLGVPFYLVYPSSSTTASTGGTDVQGMGNVYAQVRFGAASELLNFSSTLTGAAPTGDREQGLSIGHATIDWSNGFEHSFGRLAPFAEIGIANAVSDTMFFVRPYTSSGLVTHFRGGARYRLARWVNIGGSGYAIQPLGTQTVISRIVGRGQSAAATPGANSRAQGRNQGVFETTTVVTGTSDLAKDRGVSTWLTVAPSSHFEVYAGYTRSTQFDLNVFFFGTGVHLRSPKWF